MSTEPYHHMQRVNETLGVVFRKNGFEAVDYSNPAQDLMDKERRAGVDVDELRDESVSEEEAATREETFNSLLDFVMRRLYATAWAFRKDLIGDMSQRDLAKMFEETPGAMSWRVNRMFTDYFKSAGIRGRLAGQKPLEAVAKYAEAAKGNQNRKGGKKSKKNK